MRSEIKNGMKKVLSTKTLDKETIAYAGTLDMEIQCIDFIEVNAVEFQGNIPLTQSYDALVFTSSNAVIYFFEYEKAMELITGKKVFAINGKTVDELARHNIKTTASAKNAADLANLIVENEDFESVLHVCGSLRLDVLEKILKSEGIKYTPLVVYQTVLLNNEKSNGHFDGFMFYSPSGVDSFLHSNEIAGESVCCCIGETTAAEL